MIKAPNFSKQYNERNKCQVKNKKTILKIVPSKHEFTNDYIYFEHNINKQMIENCNYFIFLIKRF
jgi:hypothetical protein